MADLAIIKYIIKETKNVWRFVFESPMYDVIDYKPGQLVNLFLKTPLDPIPHVRSYSIASYPDNSNTFELVTDLDLWKFEIPVERFISKVTQMYAYQTIISKTKEDGYQVVEQKNKNDGSIELVLTKWDS